MPGVYVSFPFCSQKCTFCNFASGVFPRSLEAGYRDALLREIGSHSWQWIPETLYVGGGTPSQMDIRDLGSILALLPGRPWREATLEAAPGSLTAERVRAWCDYGINRVSLGVQSFVTLELARTGRRHNSEIVESDCSLLREHGVANINIDLICGLPHQTPESWNESLDWIARLEAPHVSVYMFEIDEDSRLGLEVLGGGSRYDAPSLPGEALTADLYESAVERLAAMGIERYEISNFARPGAESLHNLKYWLREPYIGFGADAHSFDGAKRWSNPESAAEYVAGPGRRDEIEADAQEERFFVGLRLLRGIRPEPEDWERYRTSIDRLIRNGVLEQQGDRLRLTPRGILVSNEVFQEFID